ncbi:MAG: PSD1 and planctomycete cytochrome C domain-containing protein [Planctomycetota bacterium]|nr:PSD1 and planctomycete cytochrome C domain-containing protein [Planctomycetota bacterium]
MPKHPSTSRFTLTLAGVFALLMVATVSVADDVERGRVEFFESKIRPVLVQHCYQCHSSTSKSVKGGLMLDFRTAALKGGESGPTIVPGKPEESLLISALKYDGLEMPPKGKLPDSVIADFERWVRDGAVDPRTEDKLVAKKTQIDYAKAAEFWAFRKPVQATLPEVKNGDWSRNEIDRFVLAKLDSQGLTPSEPADRRVLIRRVFFDLIGLPPDPEEVEAFVSNPSPNALDEVISQLLDSPHYGERWGRHWLDVARYGEDQAHTFKARNYPRGYFYRDWVVQSLNADMPYDEFVRQQIAGDLLDGPDRHTGIAPLGLFALGPVYYAENVEKDRAAADEWDDRLDTLTRGVLGLTVACARCHDHKYDPISMHDYYGLAGVFASSKYEERPIVAEAVVAQRRAADDAAKEQQLGIDRFMAAESRMLRPTLVAAIPDYMTTAWTVLSQRKKGKDQKKLIESTAKEAKLSEVVLSRWVTYLDSKPGSAIETAALQEWSAFWRAQPDDPAVASDEQRRATVQQIAESFRNLAMSKLERREGLFKRFGENIAFVRQEDQTVVRAGIIPLGNLFDDSASVSLAAALATDKFKATASADRLGVDHVAYGWGTETRVAPDVQFDFAKLGANSLSYGQVINDAWFTQGGISTQGRSFNSNKRVEQGIGMHANALVTFDLDEIRRAGLMPADQKFVFKVDRAGINDDAFGSGASAHLAVIVSRPHRDKAVMDAILSAQVNGQKMEIDFSDFTYYIAGQLPDPIRADGRFVAFDIPIPAEAKHLTLVACGADDPADNTISSDHVVFSGVRLEMHPLPVDKLASNESSDTPDVSEEDAERDRQDAILLSRLLYDEGLLALPPAESESLLPPESAETLTQLRQQLAGKKKSAEAIAVPMAHSLNEATGHDLPIYLQGDPAKKGESAARSIPAILTGGERSPFESSGSGRKELAEAITSPDNSLIARVIVNRVWAGHFGHGLVRTTSNFGQLGERPSHPELLDWLSVWFVENGWSLKKLHRLIVQSSAWQQSSEFEASAYEADPENQLLWRMNRRRLEIEPWRDGLLSVSGELDPKLGGPSADLNRSDNRRRTIYGFVSRHRLDELLRLFDFPDPSITSANRSVTTVPLQQLFVLNSEFMAQRARALVQRLNKTVAVSDEDKVRQAYLLLFGRPADTQEIATATGFLSGSSEGEKLSRWEQFSLALLSANEFLYLD